MRLVFLFDCISCNVAPILTIFCVGDEEMQLGEIRQERRGDATIKSKRLMGQKMHCGSQLVDSYIKDHR
jgi:hypothetical protein